MIVVVVVAAVWCAVHGRPVPVAAVGVTAGGLAAVSFVRPASVAGTSGGTGGRMRVVCAVTVLLNGWA